MTHVDAHAVFRHHPDDLIHHRLSANPTNNTVDFMGRKFRELPGRDSLTPRCCLNLLFQVRFGHTNISGMFVCTRCTMRCVPAPADGRCVVWRCSAHSLVDLQDTAHAQRASRSGKRTHRAASIPSVSSTAIRWFDLVCVARTPETRKCGSISHWQVLYPKAALLNHVLGCSFCCRMVTL